MSAKKQIFVNDFALFFEAMKATTKVVESAKLTINENGLQIYGVKDRIARCEIITNAVTSQEEISFSILNMNMLVKVLSTVKEIHGDDYTDFTMFLDQPQLKFQSKKFKTKMQCCNEDVIAQWISKKIEAEMHPVFEFTTTSDLIRRIGSHAYIFEDAEALRVYLETKPDMENNSLFASIGNRANNLNNEMTLKFGIVTFGKLDGRELVLDLERINLFNAVTSNDIKISLMDRNVLVSRVKVTGKNDTFFSLTVYNSILKN